MSEKSALSTFVVQLCSSDDTHENQQKILQHLAEVPRDTHVVFLPENSLFMRISSQSPVVGLALDDGVYDPFREWSKNTKTHILFGANPTQTPLGVTNSTVWIQPSGRISDPYSKIHLFDVDVEGHKPVRESDQFVAGSHTAVIEINGWKIGLSVCYDVRFPELFLQYSKIPVDVIAVPAAFLVPTGKAHWEILLRARAIESQCYVVAAAQAGEHRGQNGGIRHSYGHSFVVDPWGRVLKDLDQKIGGEALTLDPSVLMQVRQQIPMASHRKL